MLQPLLGTSYIGNITYSSDRMRSIPLIPVLALALVGLVTIAATQSTIEDLEKNLATVSRQLMLQQLYVEEQARSSGNSGLKRVRQGSQGSRPYHSASHVAWSLASIHNHPMFVNTLGMGELVAVLNGVEFRTRHNDYKLRMKSKTSTSFGETEDIPFPQVPGSVTNLGTVSEQIDEMRQWFKAWQDQDHSVRDYRPYFKPLLCYLEGSWTNSDQNSIDESFDSDRHMLDAKSWLDMQEKIRFTSWSGSKDSSENFAFLPTTILSLINDTIPVLAQWNYQILCHPLKDDLPLNRMRPVDDLKTMMAWNQDQESYLKSRAARFTLAQKDSKNWYEGPKWHSYLDELMEQIPGPDNYPGNITDDTFGEQLYQFDSTTSNPIPLNTAYYHRYYRTSTALSRKNRGFSDETLFVAQTTQNEISGLEVEKCNRQDECAKWFKRSSYAIPLEIVYMTPLASWNPYNIQYKGHFRSDYGKTVQYGPDGTSTRNGEPTLDKAFNGTNSKKFFQTPVEFFLGDGYDPTTTEYVSVLDSEGDMKRMWPSGTYIHLPDIPEVGTARLRYPIMPVHGEGSGVWKELEALKDIVLEPRKYRRFYKEEPIVTSCDTNCETLSPAQGRKNEEENISMMSSQSKPVESTSTDGGASGDQPDAFMKNEDMFNDNVDK